MILVADSIILPVSAACAGFYEKRVPILYISKSSKQSRFAAQTYGYFKPGPESGKSCTALLPLNTLHFICSRKAQDKLWSGSLEEEGLSAS